MSGDQDGKLRVEHTVNIAARMAKFYLQNSGERATILEAIANGLDGTAVSILRTASEETALTEAELAPEFARMSGTLRMFAALVREGSWVRAAIDTARAAGAGAGGPAVIGPGHDVRRMLMPLDGVVAVFGASNFPLAYGVCGGDTASALAAGCAVVVKEHPAHPRTGRLIAAIARRAILSAGAPEDVLGYIHNPDPEDYTPARELVMHPRVAAVGFTGSRGGGMALESMARERERPIPVFAEMGSSNIVVITRAAAAERGDEIARELASSILARFGQQCTNTGLVLIDSDGSPSSERARDGIIERLREALTGAPARDMLSVRVRRAYEDRLDEIWDHEPERVDPVHRGSAGEGGGDRRSAAALIVADSSDLRDRVPYREEIFGPACIAAFIDLEDEAGLAELLAGLNDEAPWGQLVACIYLGSSTRPADVAAMGGLTRFAGRLVVNGPPTGVRVAPGMVHGGPWPATNRPDTTAVGPYAIERWCRPVCYQNCPDALLPAELRDANPLGILRVVNGAAVRTAIAGRGSIAQ